MKIKQGIPIREFFDINSSYGQAEIGNFIGLSPSATCRALQRGDTSKDVYVVEYEDNSIGWLRAGRDLYRAANLDGLRFK